MSTVYTYNNKVLKNSANDKWLTKKVDPYNPLGLPGWTIRIKMAAGSTAPVIGGATVTAVQGQTDIYDVCTEGGRGNAWNGLFSSMTGLIEVLGANSWNSSHTTTVTSLQGIFANCSSLTSVPLFDTSSVSNMNVMFAGCSSLTSVPLFDTSSVTNVGNMLKNCLNVESGALALYQRMSTQTTPPTVYGDCFLNCGSNTTTGAAELAQIPSSWGGTGA